MKFATPTVPEPSHRRLSFCAPWMIFWVALAVRVVVILVGRTYRMPVVMDHFEYGWEVGRIARSLVQGQGYANPFNGPSGPTAWLSPLYPLLMAVGFKLFGVYTWGAAAFVLVCNSVFSASTAMAIYEIGARCFDARGVARRSSKQVAPVGLWSAWVWALYPAAMQYAVHWLWEMSLSTFLFAWAIVVALRLRGVGESAVLEAERIPEAKAADFSWSMRPETEVSGYPSSTKPRSEWLRWVWLGVLWGLVALSNSSLLLCLPAMIVWIAWPNIGIREQGLGITRSGWLWRMLGGAALTTLAFGVVLAPWVVRNERVLHAFVPTRSNLGIELYESTLEGNDGFPWGTTLPLWPGDPEFQRFVAVGEIRFARMRSAEAKERIRAQPGLFVRRAVDRFFFFWDDTPHATGRHPSGEYLRRLQYAFLSLCGLLGLGLMLRRRVEGAGLFASCFVLVPIPYYLVTVSARFRHPLEPLIAVLGVYLFRSAKVKTVDR